MMKNDPTPTPPNVDTDAPLQQLIDLVTQTVSSEQAMTRWDDQVRREIDRKRRSEAETIQQRHVEQVERLTRESDDALASAQGNFGERWDQMVEQQDLALEQLKQENEQRARSVRDQLNQALWLADSTFEGVPERLQRTLDDVRKQVEQEAVALKLQRTQSTQLLQQWKVKPQASAPVTPPQTPEDPESAFVDLRDTVTKQLDAMAAMGLPRFTFGTGPTLLTMLFSIAAVAVGSLVGGWLDATALGIGAGTGLALGLITRAVLRVLARRAVSAAYVRFTENLLQAEATLKAVLLAAIAQHQKDLEETESKHNKEIAAARLRMKPLIESTQQQNADALAQHTQTCDRDRAALKAEKSKALQRIERKRAEALSRAEAKHTAAEAASVTAHQQAHAEHDQESGRRWNELIDRWEQGLRRCGHFGQTDSTDGLAWDESAAWNHWTPPQEATGTVRFGHVHVNLEQLPCGLPRSQSLRQSLPGPLRLPTRLRLKDKGSLLIRTGPDGRTEAITALRSVMTRLLTQLPPGRVRFTVVDPVDLGRNFAGFMHLADHDESLIGKRILTDPETIEQHLADLSAHLENVIQKCLRNEFDSIDDYNAQAGELAEPYRFLVISDFPVGFSETAIRRLNSIVSSGPRCGVYTLMVQDMRRRPDRSFRAEGFKQHAAVVERREDHWHLDDPVLGDFPLHLDPAPSESLLSDLMERVGRGAKEASRIEVPFETVEPAQEDRWSASAAYGLQIPIGSIGAKRQQVLSLGRGVAQHVLIGGKTGSGKTTLLHTLLTNLALWYRPEEVQLYMVDFKRGIEFKTYATAGLPHARAIAIESDREFGVSILRRIDAEMHRRGELFRAEGVQDLPAYRQAVPEATLPRILLVIDEFQEFFSDDDPLAQDASLLLDRMVRQGRAFGMHLVLGTQTLAGSYGLARSTLGQIAVRIALQCNEADSELILSDGNTAARLLGRPGEAIYNDTSGMVEANSPFQVAWLDDNVRDERLKTIAELAAANGVEPTETIVFDGTADADVTCNRPLERLLNSPGWSTPPSRRAFLGEPIAIKDPTAAVKRRLNGRNLLIVGQRDQEATAMLCTSMVSLASQERDARFVILDGLAPNEKEQALLERTAASLPHETQTVAWRQTEQAIASLHAELNRRLMLQSTDQEPSYYLIIRGLQRYRMLRRQEDDFSFSAQEKPPTPEKQLVDLLRDGPPVGMHTLAWCDSNSTLERTFDRGTLREFETRVLFQMSATDSSHLIDSPEASRLGLHRSLLHNEEDGIIERFRPYAPPPKQWLDAVGDQLQHKAARSD